MSVVQCAGSSGEGMLSTGVQAIAAGGIFTCALVNGGVQCWGGNFDGELGNNSTTDSSVPVSASGLTTGVGAIDTHYEHTCALANGGIQCWGRNLYGELGNSSITNSHVPTPVVDLTSGAP